MKKHTLSTFAAALVAGVALVDARPVSAVGTGPGTIVDVVAADGSFTILTQALQVTALDQVLAGAGPMTLFAPTDAAFQALGQPELDALLNDPPTLRQILLYHVVLDDVSSSEVMAAPYLGTDLGQRVDISTDGVDFFVDQAKLTTFDVLASNGRFHVIDAVMRPNLLTVLGTAQDAGNFTTLDTAVTAAGLDVVLNGVGPVTVFAPDDAAFDLLPQAGLQGLLMNQIPLLTLLLQYHVVPGRLYEDDLVLLSDVTTLLGARLNVRVVGTEVFVNNARITTADVEAVNGNVHVVDKVLAGERVL